MNLPIGFRRLKRRLMAYVIVALAPLIVLDTLAQNQAWKTRKDAVLQNSLNIAMGISGAVESFIVNLQAMQRASATALAAGVVPPSRAASYLAKIRAANPDIRSSIVVDARGIVVASDSPKMSGQDMSGTPWFKDFVQRGGNSYVSDAFVSGRTGGVMFSVAAAIREGGRLKLALVCTVEHRVLTELSKGRLPRDASIAIIDTKGRVVASNVPELERARQTVDRSYVPSIRTALEGKSAFLTDWRDPLHKDVEMGAASPVERIGWVVSVMQNQATAFKPVEESRRRDVAILLLFAALSLLLAWFFGHQITSSVEQLTKDASRLAAGELTTRSAINRDDEIGQLARSFNQMAGNLEALHNISRAAGAVLDIDALFQSVASEVAKATGFDMCGLGLVSEDKREISFVAASGAWSSAWRDLRIPVGSGACGRAVLEKETVLDVVAHIDDEPCRRLLAPESICSGAIVPIVAGDEVIGVLAAYHRTPRQIGENDARLSTTMASLAAVGIQNARAYEREHRIAATLQRSFLPDIPAGVGDFEVAHVYRPAHKEAEVGGDFYDFFRIKADCYGVVIGDVAGKGLSAAVDAVMSKYMLRAFASEDHQPQQVLRRLNEALSHSLESSSFITLIFGILDVPARTLTFACAGHEPPLLYRSDGQTAEFRKPAGRVAGALPEADYETDTLQLNAGDCLLFYTDGVTEARNNGEFFRDIGLRDAVLECLREKPIQALIDGLLQRVLDFAGGEVRDDIAMLAIRLTENSQLQARCPSPKT
ncbi:MAG: SpoIIE family protein phosphatase [Armatimonadota bacterium]|nr:SpoIIE family protein phosphatase [Armatimonadota bacterium]